MFNYKKYDKTQILCLLLIIIFIVTLIACYINKGYLMRNTVWGWGDNDDGQLGDGIDVDERVVPAQTDLSNVKGKIIDVSAGDQFTLAVTENGEVWAWGGNYTGQLGNSSTIESNTPIPTDMTSMSSIVDVVAGYDHSLAIDKNGNVWAWGDNDNGELGDDTNYNTFIPVQTNMTSMPSIVDIAAGYYHSLAIDVNSDVWAWGGNDYGQLGNDSTITSLTPVQTDMTSMPAIVDITAGAFHSLAIDENGDIWAWGDNNHGQLGNDSTTTSLTPVQTDMGSMPTIVNIAAGDFHSLALDINGTVWAWGDNKFGQLGNGSTTTSLTPIQTDMTSMPAIVDIAAGDNHSLALDVNGDVWAWGNNYHGKLGNASTYDRYTPVKVYNISKITNICAGGDHSIAVQQANPYIWILIVIGAILLIIPIIIIKLYIH